MSSRVCNNPCFWFGVVLNLLLLSLAVYTAKSGKPFAVWVSLLVAFLLTFLFVVTISLAHSQQSTRGHSAYIVPMADEEIELYHIARSPPPSIDDEDVAGHEAYRQFLATRPLPPPPVASPPRRRAAFPTPLSPLSDPFIDRDVNAGIAGSTAGEGRQTIRGVPASSGMLCPVLTPDWTLLTNCTVISRV